MKKLMIGLVFALSISANAENMDKKTNNEFGGDSIIFSFNEKDKAYDQYYKKIEVYNKNKQLVKAEYYHTEKVVGKTGIIKQFEFYNESRIPIKYELFFSDKEVKNTNVNKVIEYVDKNDQMTSLEYYSNNELIDKETKDFRYYPYLKMNVNGELIQSQYKEFRDSGKKEDYIVIEGKQTRGKALVRYENKVQPLSAAELKNIDTVGKAFADKKYREFLNNNYRSKILVKEGDVEYWICMQEPLLKYLKNNQRMVVWYYFLGGFNGEPLFISTGFTDVK